MKKFKCARCDDKGNLIRYGNKDKGEPHIVKSFCKCDAGNCAIENQIKSAWQFDGTYRSEWVEMMNQQGVQLSFMKDGVRWTRSSDNVVR